MTIKIPGIKIPGIDEREVMELYEGEMDIFLPVLRSYASTVPVTLEKIRTVSAETLHGYMVTVHGVKSTSASIGAKEAKRMAAELEVMAKAGDINGILAKNGEFLKYIEVLLGNVKKWLKEFDSE